MSRDISVHQLEPGMIPESDLRSRNGRLLVVRGTPLSRIQIRALKTWGVNSVTLRDSSDQENTFEDRPYTKTDDHDLHDPKLQDQAEKMILPRFARTDLEHPAMREMYSLAKIRVAKELKSNPDLVHAAPKSTQTRMHGEILFGKNQPQPDSINFKTVNPEDLGLLSLPSVSLNLQKALIDPKCTQSTVADLINKDPNLSSRLLKLINSSLFGLPFKVESIYQAITIIGSKQVSMLVLGLTFRSMFRQIAPASMDIKQFWKHCMACAVAARTMGAGMGGVNPERLFLAGLLHDIGWLILMNKFPIQMARVQKMTRQGEITRQVAESQVFGMDHAKFGATIIAKWKFSLILENTIRYHHEPAHSLNFLETGILHTADILVHAFGINKIRGENVPGLDFITWEALSLDPAVFGQCMKQIDRIVH